MLRRGYEVRGRSGGRLAVVAASPLVRGAGVDDPEPPPGRGVGLGGHDFGDQVGERLDAGLWGDPPQHSGAVDVVGGEVGQGAAAAVLELDPAGWPAAGPCSPGEALRGPGMALLIGSDFRHTRAPRVAIPYA